MDGRGEDDGEDDDKGKPDEDRREISPFHRENKEGSP
jgi:hypothetical protein